MSERVFISDFVKIKPPIKMSQEESVLWLTDRHRIHCSPELLRTIDKNFHYYGVKKDRIAYRYLSIGKGEALYAEENCDDIGLKSDFFAKHTISVFNEFYPTKPSLPEHVIHVTCTGYVSPSAPQVVIGQLEAQAKVTHAYHMGCYAALPAIRTAAALVKSGDSKKVDVAHTELCSLHMDAKNHTPEQIVIQTLFADGNIRYSLSSSKGLAPSFELICQKEMILPDTNQDMRWEVKKWGFAMTLSRLVPEKLTAALPGFMDALAKDVGMKMAQLIKESIFAIHPGGPRIIDALAAQFDLCEEQIRYSQKVLYERGNMSSATLPHVWEEIISAALEDGKIIVSLAFGPGLSIFASVFKFRR